ncbi:MAG: choice-of-anchor Q domain-containing protein [Rudaea sp.]
MNTQLADGISGIAQRQLALGLALAFVAMGVCTAGHASPAAHTVNNCNDSGAGSLRATIGEPTTLSGDTVNFNTPLGCSAITLTTGEIVVTQSSLIVTGPGADVLSIDGNFNGRVMRHSGGGTLTLSGLTITHGKYASNSIAAGGCLVSNGSIALNNSKVLSCVANAKGDASAYGGGVFTVHDLTLANSRIAYNTAVGAANQTHFVKALGGGAKVSGNLQVTYSTISNNSATTPDLRGFGGGLYTNGNATVGHTTIASNHADQSGGWSATANTPSTVSIADSTLSGNSARNIAGMQCRVPLTLSNSTVAFNQAEYEFGGLYVSNTLVLQSSIVAANIVQFPIGPGTEGDLNGPATLVVSGFNSLVTSSPVALPPDTLTACPKLGPLADNGGPTLTHALLHNSPAINHGNSELYPVNDQRGPGFTRLFGNGVDIGAYEWHGTPDDRLFVSRFESTCDN